MKSKNIIVIGASAGGFEALKLLVNGLPSGFPAALFIVWHMAPEVHGILPQVLNRLAELPAAEAVNGEVIEHSRIYTAPPDRHMMLDNGFVRITRGPKENRFRPAIDPLFRSAAYEYGSNVIGVILSGSLDDGTSGLWTIKNRGGTAVVQDPNDAEVPSMPASAMREVQVDHVMPIAQISELLVKLVSDRQNGKAPQSIEKDDRLSKQLKVEIGIAAEDNALEAQVMEFGELTPYTCPECHGVLSSLREGTITRFRCHTGHAFTADSLLVSLTEDIEDSLWTAIRGVDESIILLNHMGDHFAEANQPKLAAAFFRKAKEAQQRNELIRRAVFSHEKLSADGLRQSSDVDPKHQSDSNGREMSASSDH